MKKIILAVCFLVAVGTANAGFVTGVVVGAALSNSPRGQTTPPTTVFSDKHDVIACEADGNNAYGIPYEYCGYDTVRHQYITPAQYAGRLGYRWIHKRGVTFVDGIKYLVLEVSK